MAIMRQRPATMKDIARKAGVNQSTVSRVLGGRRDVSISAGVRRRILRTARALDYHHNLSAVALRTGSTKTVMVVVSDITDLYFSAIISGIQEVLINEGYSLVLHSLAHAGPPGRLPSFLHRYRLDGALMLGAPPGMTDQSISMLADRGVPFILVGHSVADGSVPSVTVDNLSGGQLAAKHLWGLGHRKIAVMRGLRKLPDTMERVRGFRREIGRAPSADIRFFPCISRQMESGYTLTGRLLATWRPTAIFCMNDATAIGSIRAITERGLRVPEDVSLVGFDDGEYAEFSSPPLTTLRQPRAEMGRESARQLVRCMKKPGALAVPLVLPVQLVVRRSTCPPR
jgi:DNA-binding LacI/PurR family transcriptional regulator